MFRDDSQSLTNTEKFEHIFKELDEIKRYVAHTYKQVDDNIADILNLLRKIDSQLTETDRQVDHIERFDRTLNEINSRLKSIEKKI